MYLYSLLALCSLTHCSLTVDSQSSRARCMEGSALALINAGASVECSNGPGGRGNQPTLLELAVRITHQEIFQVSSWHHRSLLAQ